MNGLINENQLTIVEEYEFIKPLSRKIDSIIDNCIRDCNNKHFHTFEYKCVYNIKLTNFGNNEAVILTNFDKNMGFYEVNKKLIVAGKNGFIFMEIVKLFKSIKCKYT